jgi:hypothetical protein
MFPADRRARHFCADQQDFLGPLIRVLPSRSTSRFSANGSMRLLLCLKLRRLHAARRRTKSQTRLPISHRDPCVARSRRQSEIQNGQENVGRCLREGSAFKLRQTASSAIQIDGCLEERRCKLLQLELILLCFRHQELSGESRLDEIVERLVNVGARMSCDCNLPQREKSVGHNREGEKAE